jgi:hypothetical protein
MYKKEERRGTYSRGPPHIGPTDVPTKAATPQMPMNLAASVFEGSVSMAILLSIAKYAPFAALH